MSATAEKLDLGRFRVQYAGTKPSWELLHGEAVQKPWPRRLHSILQFLLAVMLKELGFKARPELTLAIDSEWEPIPDVSGILGTEEDPYPSRPIAVAIEILSPDDRFMSLMRKCRKYAAWGIKDILVFDPVNRQAWFWDAASGDARTIQTCYRFSSLPAQISLVKVWSRFDQELNS